MLVKVLVELWNENIPDLKVNLEAGEGRNVQQCLGDKCSSSVG